MDSYPPVIRVSQAIEFCNSLFSELTFSIEGEVANYSVSRGKFVFFDLKDEEEEARLSCFMMLYQQSVPLEDGMRIVVQARPSLFAKSGKFSLTVQRVEPKGEGSVKRAFELLVKKLEGEGLFATDRKRPLPPYPQRVGVISSADAAGFGDFMRIANSRLPGVEYILANVAVQGVDAEAEICRAFDHLNTYEQVDVIVLTRGGGSMEDLHAFNSEVVARAIVRSKVPVLVGVGHERDVTVADYCADVRAATPSNAAQLLLPTREEVEELVKSLVQSGHYSVEHAIRTSQQGVAHSLETMTNYLTFTIRHTKERVQGLITTIDAISPQRTLARGYSITRNQAGQVLTASKGLKKGDLLTTQLADGSISSIITTHEQN